MKDLQKNEWYDNKRPETVAESIAAGICLVGILTGFYAILILVTA